MAPNIYCCGAGTTADTEAVTDMVKALKDAKEWQNAQLALPPTPQIGVLFQVHYELV
ncbi:unnamed protein product [Arabidopsis lyrata]|nr:unnamed protein product [Arabidopsis lyrata]